MTDCIALLSWRLFKFESFYYQQGMHTMYRMGIKLKSYKGILPCLLHFIRQCFACVRLLLRLAVLISYFFFRKALQCGIDVQSKFYRWQRFQFVLEQHPNRCHFVCHDLCITFDWTQHTTGTAHFTTIMVVKFHMHLCVYTVHVAYKSYLQLVHYVYMRSSRPKHSKPHASAAI